MLYLVSIMDKELFGEPDIGVAIVDAPDEAGALALAEPALDKLREAKRCRCVPRAKSIEIGKFYRVGALLKLPSLPSDRGSLP